MKQDKKISIIFMPYNISMWDSLESIYEAAIKDKECDVKVIPLPYYEKNKNNKFIYEGEEFKKLGIEVVHYEDFISSNDEVDIIFIHNIYDDCNIITQVDERFFTKELRKYTKKILFVPYYIPSPIIGFNEMYTLPGIDNVDQIILAGGFAEKTATIMGVNKEKILTLGSPKFDSALKKINKKNIPYEWKDKIKGKKVILLNTRCVKFMSETAALEFIELERYFDIARYLDNVILIWRPHPLTDASMANTIRTYYGNLCDKIRNNSVYYPNIILDETNDYMNAVSIADVLVSPYSSIVNTFLLTQKPILLTFEHNIKNSILPDDYSYYIYDKKEPWYMLIKKLILEDYDPLKEKRKNAIENIYINTDGTCGEKVFKKVKNTIDIRE